MYRISFIEKIYYDRYFGRVVYYIPDHLLYRDEVPMLIVSEDNEEICYSVGITHRETIELDLEAYFYASLYKWMKNTGDPLYVWLFEKIKETVDVESFLDRIRGYEICVLNVEKERYREMLKWQISFDLIVYLIRWGYYERIRIRQHLMHHRLGLVPIISPEVSTILEKLGLLDDRYFECFDNECRKSYLKEKLLDLVKPSFLRRGLHLWLHYYTDDLIRAMRNEFPEWFVES